MHVGVRGELARAESPWGRARNARINLGRPDAQWESEDMHAGRVMGDMLILPAGDMLLLNGAAKGCSSWGFGRQPVPSPES